MPMTPRWLDTDQRFLVVELTGDGISTWDEYHAAIERAWAMVSSVPYEVIPVVAGYDYSMPHGSPMTHVQWALRTRPRNIPFVVSIADKRFEATVLSMIARLTQKNAMRTVTSWAEVNRLLAAEGKPTIPEDIIPQR
ncbi:MAG: hypothetical protein AAF125_03980 [Chloroflexota bacterium]